ncbi:MAG: hypothetical protein IT311_05135 [Anaerolineales bacterium]|nr:hypothetical protein [Anaerolineales bacterium]
MKKKKEDDRVVYSLCVSDIRYVASEILNRKLTLKELKLIQDKVGDYISWYDAIELAIEAKIASGEIRNNEDE